MTDVIAASLTGLAAILVLLFLLWVLRRIGRGTREVTGGPGLWDGRDYRCPACGTAMDQGWLLFGRGAVWSPRGRGQPGALTGITAALPNTISLSLRPACNMAWHCPRCQLLVADHSKLVKPP